MIPEDQEDFEDQEDVFACINCGVYYQEDEMEGEICNKCHESADREETEAMDEGSRWK